MLQFKPPRGPNNQLLPLHTFLICQSLAVLSFPKKKKKIRRVCGTYLEQDNHAEPDSRVPHGTRATDFAQHPILSLLDECHCLTSTQQGHRSCPETSMLDQQPNKY